MLKEKQADIVLTNEEDSKFNNILLYERCLQQEVDLIKEDVNKEVEKQLLILESTKNTKNFKNNLSSLCCTKYSSLFGINNFSFYSMKKYKEYVKANIALAFPLSSFSFLFASNNTLLSYFFAAGWFIVAMCLFFGFSYYEYKSKNKKILEEIKKQIHEKKASSSYYDNIKMYFQEKPVSLEHMKILKKIIPEETMKEILYESKGNPQYDNFNYIVLSEKNKIENKILKKNVEEIYSNI